MIPMFGESRISVGVYIMRERESERSSLDSDSAHLSLLFVCLFASPVFIDGSFQEEITHMEWCRGEVREIWVLRDDICTEFLQRWDHLARILGCGHILERGREGVIS